MDGYAIALVIHIIGALGFFMALGLEWSSLYQARQARTVEQLRAWLTVARGSYRVGMPAMIVLVGSGIYLMRMAWGGAAWIIVSVGVLVLIMGLVLVLIRPRLRAIDHALAAEQGSLSSTTVRLVQHAQLWIPLQIRFTLALAIVFLMTVKPDRNGVLLTLGGRGCAWPGCCPAADRTGAHTTASQRITDAQTRLLVVNRQLSTARR